jgi:capsular polysaccharide transport system permease protein
MVFIPVCIALIYIFVIAVKLYRSESAYVVRDLATTQSVGVDLGIFGLNTATGNQDAYHVIEYLRSMEILEQVEERFELKKRYTSFATDILERLWPWSSREDFLELFRKHLIMAYDPMTNITHITFDSSDPKLAKNVLAFLLEKGTLFLNTLNKERAEAKTRIAWSMLEKNRASMDKAVSRVESFQVEHRLVDPNQAISTQSGIVAHLEGELVAKTAELNQLASYLNSDTFDVARLRKEIAEIKAALERSKSRMTGQEHEQLNELAFEFQRLKAEADFAMKAYEQTLIQYEVAKLEAQNESKIFEVLYAPTLPDGHVYPQRFILTLSAIFLIFALAKIIQLLWAVVQDHKD